MSVSEASKAQQGLSGYVDIKFLKPDACEFFRSPGGFLSLRAGDDVHPRVFLYRSFPFSHSDEYISVRKPEGEEIGIIRRIDDFDRAAQELIREELDRRYFSPAITAIKSVKEEFGYAYWDVETKSGPRRFTVRDSQQNIVFLTPVHVLIIDVDGNRFEIPDYEKLDPASRRVIENLF